MRITLISLFHPSSKAIILGELDTDMALLEFTLLQINIYLQRFRDGRSTFDSG